MTTLTTAALLATLAMAQEPADAGEVAEAEGALDEAPAPEVTRHTYTLDPGRSDLYVIVYNDHDRFTPVAGHDHAIEASRFDGKVTWDTADASACDVRISFPVDALVIDPPGLRERAGLDPEGSIPDSQKSTVIGNMSGKKNLNASVNPRISFQSTQCAGTTGTVPVTGTMTIAGVSQTITVPMKVKVDGASFTATGRYEFGHGDYGMVPFTYGPLTPKNQEKLTIVIDVKGSASGG